MAGTSACALLAVLGAGVLGYLALRLLQRWLALPELLTTLSAVAGALAGCSLGLRLVPAAWLDAEDRGT